MAVLRCPTCGSESPATSQRFECACGGLFDVEHALRPLETKLFDARRLRAHPPLDSGVWRFRELVYHRFPRQAIVSLHEGNTPLYASPEVGDWAGVDDLHLKHEGLNPTGSFKDRGMTVAVSRARASNAGWVACASTGNTASSMAAYAAAAGLNAMVVVPEAATAVGKLSQAIAYGARAVQIRGDFDAAMGIVRDLARRGEVYLLNSLNPFRIEGQKSIVLELIQQLGWKPPDWIVFPAGNLGNCAAFGKALREARARELIRSTPRLAAVQAAGANPFASAFRDGFRELRPVRARTIASAIRVGAPVSYARAVQAILDTDGVVTDVEDDEILEAKAVVDAAGIGAEPASCAAVAGVRRLVSEGHVQPWDRVVCVLTGHLLKDPETTLAYHRGDLGEVPHANPPVVVDADGEAVRELLRDD